jgi:hypothetical protein
VTERSIVKRIAVFLAGAIAALATAGTAFASYAPRLVVSSAGPAAGGATRIGVVVPTSDTPTARLSIYVPNGYTLATPGPGKLGDVTATIAAADLGDVVLPVTGELDAIAPTDATNAVAALCGVAPSQTWQMHLSASGQTLDIPLFVVAPAPAEAAAGYAAKLVACLPPPDVPAGTPGRAIFGARLLSATITSSAIAEPVRAGDYRWTSVWTPYNPGAGTPNLAGSVEAQSLRHLPVVFRLATARRKVIVTKRVNGKKLRVVVTRVGFAAGAIENGAAPSKIVITTTARGKKIGGAKGSFAIVGFKSLKLTATAVIDSDSGAVPTGQPATVTDLFFHDLGATACTATAAFGGLPCLDATVGGERLVATATVRAF